MSLFSKQNKEVFMTPLNLDHPILIQVLGICSALAVTSQLKPSIVMGLAVTWLLYTYDAAHEEGSGALWGGRLAIKTKNTTNKQEPATHTHRTPRTKH